MGLEVLMNASARMTGRARRLALGLFLLASLTVVLASPAHAAPEPSAAPLPQAACAGGVCITLVAVGGGTVDVETFAIPPIPQEFICGVFTLTVTGPPAVAHSPVECGGGLLALPHYRFGPFNAAAGTVFCAQFSSPLTPGRPCVLWLGG